jgi:hypothetical protein
VVVDVTVSDTFSAWQLNQWKSSRFGYHLGCSVVISGVITFANPNLTISSFIDD